VLLGAVRVLWVNALRRNLASLREVLNQFRPTPRNGQLAQTVSPIGMDEYMPSRGWE
jgi:hypothetical protein